MQGIVETKKQTLSCPGGPACSGRGFRYILANLNEPFPVNFVSRMVESCSGQNHGFGRTCRIEMAKWTS